MRRKLGGTVVDAARAVQYTNAGTFEFLLDDKGNFYFLEVNTRVQVEHPVTEFITGVDIVKEQIRIAAGERLSFKQGDVTFNGHAIECRVNAEDPDTFAPSPGVIHAFSVPGGPGVRVDTFAHSECTVSPYYDSMIAKIIVHGRDRQEAIARMRRTLEMTVIEGIKTSIPLHLKILADPDFVAGRLEHRASWSASWSTKKPSRRPRRSGQPERRAFLSHPSTSRSSTRRSARAGGSSPIRSRAVARRRAPAAAPRQDSSGRPAARRWPIVSRSRAHRAGRRVIVNDRADIARLPAPTASTSGRTTCRPTTRAA